MLDHLVHGYFGVDLDIVWNAIAEDLPGLRSAVERLCLEAATHTVDVTFPDLDPERWRLCRDHERLRKNQILDSRPKKPPLVAPPARPNEVRCGNCQRAIDQPSFTPIEGRMPCPDCGSLTRWIGAWVTESVETRYSLSTQLRRQGSPGWAVETVAGDSCTRELDAWGKLGRTVDRENDVYREVIELWDGTRIESTASLRDHRSPGRVWIQMPSAREPGLLA